MTTKGSSRPKTVISAAAFAAASARRKAQIAAQQAALPTAIPENPKAAQLLFAALALLETAFAATSEPQIKKGRPTGSWVAVAPQVWFSLHPHGPGMARQAAAPGGIVARGAQVEVRCKVRCRSTERTTLRAFPLEDLAQLPALQKWIERELAALTP